VVVFGVLYFHRLCNIGLFVLVASGMGVIQRIGMVATDKDGKPKHPITIHKARPYRGIPSDDEFRDANNSVLAITAGS
jgi:hypothetical protein